MKVLITGGAGFVGSNLANAFFQRGDNVTVLDNLSRRGTEKNLQWLKSQDADFHFIKGDIRDFDTVSKAVVGMDVVYHLAAQVAVTTSVTDPRNDFEINLLGSFNVLEAIRKCTTPPMILFSSTNKVYGKMSHVPVLERNGRWEYELLSSGNSEKSPLDFYSPYGCSKGGADQYIRDYCRIYGIPSTVFRMSCIYGPRQMGCEDQGWVAFFLIQAALKKPVTIFGDGKQIRDVLYVSDLVNAFISAYEKRDITTGKIYNIGGGPTRTLSLLELINFIQKELHADLPFNLDDWRPGDQKVYVSDISKAKSEFGWFPEIDPSTGLKLLHSWILENKQLFQTMG